MIWQYWMFVIGVWNVFVFLLYGMDKWKAKHQKWRISESVLISTALCLGGIGALLGMMLFHHKTRKWKFRIFVPLSVIIEAAVVYGIIS